MYLDGVRPNLLTGAGELEVDVDIGDEADGVDGVVDGDVGVGAEGELEDLAEYVRETAEFLRGKTVHSIIINIYIII